MEDLERSGLARASMSKRMMSLRSKQLEISTLYTFAISLRSEIENDSYCECSLCATSQLFVVVSFVEVSTGIVCTSSTVAASCVSIWAATLVRGRSSYALYRCGGAVGGDGGDDCDDDGDDVVDRRGVSGCSTASTPADLLGACSEYSVVCTGIRATPASSKDCRKSLLFSLPFSLMSSIAWLAYSLILSSLIGEALDGTSVYTEAVIHMLTSPSLASSSNSTTSMSRGTSDGMSSCLAKSASSNA
mmetsp:Transcript_6556/g.17811  ORF Transcript_6556/g.17811 Transcript_6556/m.17811 type:complete len:246 (-) Transcript_6556:526-1263(-)